MPIEIRDTELVRNLARRRVAELQQEMTGLTTLLGQLEKPGRRNTKSPAAGPLDGEPADGAESSVKRKRRKMTAAQRKAVSVRMRKVWAGKRKAANARA